MDARFVMVLLGMFTLIAAWAIEPMLYESDRYTLLPFVAVGGLLVTLSLLA